MRAGSEGTFLAVDVGATNLRVALFRGNELQAKSVVRTPTTGGPYAVARKILREAERLGADRVDAVGVATIGPLDIKKGMVIDTPNNPLRTFYLREPLEKEFKAKVVVANDCVAAVWGEKVLGRGRDVEDLAYVTISSGIGGGFIVDGNLIVGWRGNAHEVGHLVVDYKAEIRCGCGGLGHWEALASGAGIPRMAYIKAKTWRGVPTEAYKLASQMKLDAPGLYRLARNGDYFARELVRELNKIHAAGIASIASAFDPKIVFLGGSIFLNNTDLMLDEIKGFLGEYTLLEPPRIEVATFREDAPLMGALALVLKTPEVIKKPW
ncbi:MAG: ROK family protein [Desulfurococcales archaeon]|nr:ROK family protein [Desulfurococcales archaeon]